MKGKATAGGSTAAGPPRLRIAFISSNPSWGGSEVLWSEAALRVAEAGHHVTIIKGPLERDEPAIRRLSAAGAKLIDMRRLPLVPEWLLSYLLELSWPVGFLARHFNLKRALRHRFDLILISQGTNLDGLLAGKRVRRRGLPYVLLAHKASEYEWPTDPIHAELGALYRDARLCLFVSKSNQALTEEQLGFRLPKAEIFRNPCTIPRDWAPTWPPIEGLYRLACVGRLFPREKGQDLLLRVLAKAKWKARPIALSIFGEGECGATLRGMADLLGVTAQFRGYGDPARIWTEHHALVVPSRSEGLPMVLVEAMMAGRPAIVTRAGGTAEILRDGDTGFVADAATEEELDAALERAWARRDDWQAIGLRAGQAVRALMPEDPAELLARRLLLLAQAGV